KPRRRFLAGALALAAARLAAQEKPASKLYRIGMLESVPISAASINLGEFHRGMKELGHEEGRTYLVLYRSSEGRAERLAPLAPGIKRLGALVNADNPASLAIWKAIEAAAPELKLSVEMLDVRQPEELEGRLDAAAKAGVDSLIIGVEALAQAMVNQVVDFTL